MTARVDDENFPPAQWASEEEFWANEYDPLRPVPDRMDDLVIYEMHVGGLRVGERDASGKPLPGSFKDAIALLDHLVELGVNAIELMPMSKAEGWTWGYGTSHYFATEYSGGGRDQFKHFVRECHPARHRRAAGRRLQPFRPRRRTRRMDVRHQHAPQEHLRLVPGTRDRLAESGRWLSRQWLDRL
ncbi:MAG: hypothetical protein ACXW3G_13225, partial [Rhodoplanes sp.]